MNNYEKGKVKVVWVKDDPMRIYSKMFENKKSAVDFGEKKEDYIIFSLIDQKNMEEFSWKLLPYGRYKLYLKTLSIFQGNKGTVARIAEGLF